MSEFHYDENGMYDVSKNLLSAWLNVNSIVGKIDKVINELYGSEGFNIDYAINGLNEERKNITVCAEKIYSGVNVISQLKNTVTSYENLAVAMSGINSFKEVDNKDLYQSIAKYGHDTDITIAGFFDALTDAFKLSPDIKSDEDVGLASAIDKILENCGMVDENVIKEVNDAVLKGTFNTASDIKKVFPNLTKNDACRIFFEDMDRLSNYVEVTNEFYADVAAKYFTVQEYLDTMAEAYSGNDKILKIIEEYRLTYTNEFKSALNDIKEWAIEKGAKKITSEIVKNISKIAAQDLTVLGLSTELTGKIFGYDKLYNSSLALNGLEEVRSETATAYQNMLNKINSGNYTDADLKTASNLFDVYKSTLKSEYETMIAIEKNKMESATNAFIHWDQWIPERREKTSAQYENQIAVYETKLKEIDAMVNPFK